MIEVSNVSKYFSSSKVLSDISLEIRKGEIFGIVGQSGAGKSTLLRCLNGLEDYGEGSIKVMDKEVKGLKGKHLREFRKNLGMIFQGFNLLERKNVFKNVSLPLELWGTPKKEIKSRVEELIRLVGLEDKLYSMPKNLSGGQKQRVAIARALALNPKILLCDEATSALDPSTTKSILSLLRKINEELGITIVIVTHQMEVIKDICSDVAVIEKGVIKELGKVKDVFVRPSVAMKNLLGEKEILPGKGINIKIFFPKESSQNCIITSMARELKIDFSIVWGKLEKFRDDVLGSLVINIEEKYSDEVVSYLKSKDVSWEVIE